MTEFAAAFVGSIPENYDAGLGPYIFVDYADDIACRAAAAAKADVLELAAGTGIVSAKLRAAIAADARLVVTDLNEPMLAIAETKLAGAPLVEFRTADAMQLPFPDDSFDLIVNQFGIMFFPDKPASFREARRVLKPDGSYLFSAWDGWDANPFARVAFDVAAAFLPDDPPVFYKAPFSYADRSIVEADARAGGFTDVGHEIVAFQKEVDDWGRLAQGAVFGNPLYDEVADRGVDPNAVKAALIEALKAEFGDAPAKMPLSATVYQAR